MILLKFHLKGVQLAWWNGRVGNDSIFERLGKILVNQEMQDKLNLMEMENLFRTDVKTDCPDIRNLLGFLKFWTENPSFIEVVRQNWSSNGPQNPLL